MKFSFLKQFLLPCCILSLCITGFASAEEQTDEELWGEFLSLNDEINYDDIETVRANVIVNGAVETDIFEGTVRGKIIMLIDYLHEAANENFDLNLKAKHSGDNVTRIGANVDVRLVEGDVFLRLNEYVSENWLEDDSFEDALPMLIDTWFQVFLDEESTNVFQFEPMTYEQQKAFILSDETLDEEARLIFEKFFEALENGDLFTLKKIVHSDTKVVYILRLNKMGVVNFFTGIFEELDEMSVETEIFLELLEEALKKITLNITVVVNPEDRLSPDNKVRFYFRAVNLDEALELISLKVTVTNAYNVDMDIEYPDSYVPLY